jgi:putative hydrolase of the HAD superfamily
MGKNSAIEVVTYDAAGTLIHVAEPVGETYARIGAKFGAQLSPAALDAGFRDVFPSMPPMAFPDLDDAAIVAAERAWWRTLVERVVVQVGGVCEFDQYFDALFAYYASGSAWRVYPEVHRALESARARGLGIAVVSNFDSRLPPILRALDIAPLVDVVIHSTACGAAKPDARIFYRALEALGASPAGALHVGDSLSADYRGAVGAGMAAVLLRRRDAPTPDGIRTIRDLTALDAFLGKGR